MKRETLSLILALSVPILMILLIVGVIYIPSLFAPDPQYDFVYAADNRYSDKYYTVVAGKLVVNEPGYLAKDNEQEPKLPTLYRHHTKVNLNTVLTVEEAQQLTFSGNTESPDGYTVTCGSSNNSFFLFFIDSNRDCSKRYLRGHNTNIEIAFESDTNERYYYNNSISVGWIIE